MLNLSQSSQNEQLHAEFVRLVQSKTSDDLQLVQDATLYKEVKDIQEELSMLRPILNSQTKAIGMLRDACEKYTTIIEPKSLIDVQHGCDDRLESLTGLQSFAREISESVGAWYAIKLFGCVPNLMYSFNISWI